jgi:hypothetical protein
MRILIVAAVLLGSIAGAVAQAELDNTQKDEIAKQTLALAMANIDKAVCGDKPCAAATPEELKDPPVTLAETREVIGRAILSGFAQHCGVEWQVRNYQPMMNYWRLKQKKNDRQLAVIALVHGLIVTQTTRSIAEKGACPDRVKQELNGRIEFKS